MPSDSPDDYTTYMDLRKKAEYYKVDPSWITFEPVPVLSTPTYGDMTAASQQGQSRRNTAPTSLFAAAASAVRARRAGSISLGTLQEDANTTAETERDDTDTDLGDSPCPPPTRAPLLKSKKPLRSLVRSETYNPATRLAF